MNAVRGGAGRRKQRGGYPARLHGLLQRKVRARKTGPRYARDSLLLQPLAAGRRGESRRESANNCRLHVGITASGCPEMQFANIR